jgi:hypothetical protein
MRKGGSLATLATPQHKAIERKAIQYMTRRPRMKCPCCLVHNLAKIVNKFATYLSLKGSDRRKIFDKYFASSAF